jgi:hypothetical protein
MNEHKYLNTKNSPIANIIVTSIILDSLGMHQLAMDNIKALTKEIEQLKKDKHNG